MYHIAKSVRYYNGHPYFGASCEKAGVPSGKTYTNILEAMDDADKLSLVNPVGFFVYDVETQKLVYGGPLANLEQTRL